MFRYARQILITTNKTTYAFPSAATVNLPTQLQVQELVAQDVQHLFMPSPNQKDVYQPVSQVISEEMEPEYVQRLAYQDSMPTTALDFANLVVKLHFSLTP